jgi:dihydropteroate synthase
VRDEAIRPTIVGVINLSPESPNRDTVVRGPAQAVERAARLRAAGATIVDVGGRSSNFAVPDCGPAVERRRVTPVVRALKQEGVTVSVDTWEPAVMESAIEAGADIVNAAEGLGTPAMLRILADASLPVVVPFINGPNPRELRPLAADPLAVITRGLRATLTRARAAGIDQVILDPGTGYARRELDHAAHDALQRRVHGGLSRLRELGCPLFVALPRRPEPEETVALARDLVRAGVNYVRAHDPELVVRAIREAAPR